MKFRLFLAIDLPFPLTQDIVKLQSSLNPLGLPVVWEKSDKLHLTLNFLGYVYDGDIQKIIGAIHEAVSGFGSFVLTPQFLETLYQRHEPSLIYLAPTGDIDRLKDLQKLLRETINNLEIPQPIRFLPHITIGRLKRTDPVTTKAAIDKVSSVEFTPLSSFEVSRITLFKSLVSRSGSVYERLREFRL